MSFRRHHAADFRTKHPNRAESLRRVGLRGRSRPSGEGVTLATGALRIAMVGTRGVPARYGGFETAVEEIGRRLVGRGHEVTVYCRRGNDPDAPTEHLGMRLVTLPALRRRSLETLSHTGLSVAHLMRHRPDVAFVFNAANAPWLPIVRLARVPVATHVDGLEWRRAKWGPAGRRYYRLVESLAVRASDAIIADAEGIRRYYRWSFGIEATLLSYGAPVLEGLGTDRLAELDLAPQGFHLVVARFEPENHVDVVVEGYRASSATRPLVVVGSAPYSDAYTARVRELAGDDPRIRFLGAVWDQELLDQLYGGALTYLHGQSVGGTNPSLLRAIGAGTATVAYDVGFNREVLRADGAYFRSAGDVAAEVTAAEAHPAASRVRGAALRVRARDYDWDLIAQGYESLAADLAAGRHPRPRPHRRRTAGPESAPPARGDRP